MPDGTGPLSPTGERVGVRGEEASIWRALAAASNSRAPPPMVPD
jgi:hypothetical protein